MFYGERAARIRHRAGGAEEINYFMEDGTSHDTGQEINYFMESGDLGSGTGPVGQKRSTVLWRAAARDPASPLNTEN